MKDFFEAFINCEHTVLGKRLKPFCLSHCLYLAAIDSPFMQIINRSDENDNATVSISREQLEMAVAICGCSDGNYLRALECINYPRNWGMKFHSFNRGVTEFCAYLADYITVPGLWEKGDDNGFSNAPWILSKAAMLLQRTSMSRGEIWNMPLGELIWYSAAIAEQEGVVDFQSESEQAALREAEKAFKENQNG